MQNSVVHEILRWIPRAIFAGVLGVCAVWDDARDWIGNQFGQWWLLMSSNPWLFVIAILLFAIYIGALVLTSERKPTPPKPDISMFVEMAGFNPPANTRAVFLLLRVSNVGGLPTALHSWAIRARTSEGNPIPVRLTYADHVSLQPDTHSPKVTYPREEAIYEKTTQPIAVGGVIVGWLLGFIDPAGPAKLEVGDVVTIECNDAFGASWCIEQAIASDCDGGQRFFPGTKVTIS